MTDIATIQEIGINPAELNLPGVATVIDRRSVFPGALERAQSDAERANAELVELRTQLAAKDHLIASLNEQITDGSDPRLVDFWEKAGRIADHADFCQEYDRLAEAMNGTPRERDWSVDAEVTLRVRVNVTVRASSEESAEEAAHDYIDEDIIIGAYRDNGAEHLEIAVYDSERCYDH